MINLNKSIGFIGAGTMGEAMISALITSGTWPASAITASDVNTERLEILNRVYGIRVTEDNFGLFSTCDIIVMSVKPYHFETILTAISRNPDFRITQRKLVISIAAGITISKIEKYLYEPLDEVSRIRLPIIRVMPNTPSLVLAGMSGISPNMYTTADDLSVAGAIFKAMGNVIEFKESELDAVTAVSGSGPAYVFYFIESLIEAAVQSGLSSEDASKLVLTTIKGAVKLLEEREDTPQHLRHLVTTPGGTTEAALNVLETCQVKQAIIDAIAAATQKSREIGSR